MKIQYEIIQHSKIEDSIRKLFAGMLKKQGKVKGDLSGKADRCKWICVATVDDKVAGIGGIKKKWNLIFQPKKQEFLPYQRSLNGNWATYIQRANTRGVVLRQT